MKKIIKKIIPKKALKELHKYSKRNMVIKLIGYFKNNNKFKNNITRSNIYLIGTPTHENIGDQAIAYAEKQFLKDKFPNINVYEILDDDYFANFYCLKKYIKPEDIIFLHGGGNFGIEYFEHELIRRSVISNFKNNKIIVFPQTIDFGNSHKGKKELEKSAMIYGKHTRLYMFAREKYSYEILKTNFSQNNILFSPDIVMYLNKQKNCERKNIMVCLRNDIEKILSKEEENHIKTFVNEYKDVIFTDMMWHEKFDVLKQASLLELKWDSFRDAKCIITDRLHGMVFAAITGTPCIVFENYNHKVKGTYEWLKHLDYIYLVKSTNDAEKKLNEFINNEMKCKYDNNFTFNYFEQIINIVKS